ncbi:MAG: hypothetical protein K6E26_00530 [Clostridiales bacterium]|nr:hypothetical protein [Clostridiales bacterium]
MRTDSKTLPEKLVFKDFIKAFRAQYMYGMPDLKNYMITEQVIHKNNRDLHGIIIRSPGKRIAPVFYYEDFIKSTSMGDQSMIVFAGWESLWPGSRSLTSVSVKYFPAGRK